MDAWRFEHVKRNAAIAELCAPDSLARIPAFSDLIHMDNVNTECKNASIRRHVKQCSQQQICEFQDSSAFWVIRNERQVERSIWGNEPTILDEPPGTNRVQPKGGGGLYGAFVHLTSADHRTEDGRVEFGEVARLWRSENENPDSDLMPKARALAEPSTLARRERKATGAHRHVSSFGTVHARAAKRARTNLQTSLALQDLEAPCPTPMAEPSVDVLSLTTSASSSEALS